MSRRFFSASSRPQSVGTPLLLRMTTPDEARALAHLSGGGDVGLGVFRKRGQDGFRSAVNLIHFEWQVLHNQPDPNALRPGKATLPQRRHK